MPHDYMIFGHAPLQCQVFIRTSNIWLVVPAVVNYLISRENESLSHDNIKWQLIDKAYETASEY